MGIAAIECDAFSAGGLHIRAKAENSRTYDTITRTTGACKTETDPECPKKRIAGEAADELVQRTLNCVGPISNYV